MVVACPRAREGSPEERAEFENAVAELTDIRWRFEPVSEEELERIAHVPSSIDENVPLRVNVALWSTPRRTGSMTFRAPTLVVDGEARQLSWLDPSSIDLPDDVAALFPPAEIPDPVELPPAYEREPYRPTRRPRVRVASRTSGRQLEAAVTGFLNALSLGHVPQRGRGSVRLTPESYRALDAWYRRNAEARQAHDAEQDARQDARVEERRQAAQFNAHREDAFRQWRRDFESYQVRRAFTPSCYPNSEDTIRLSRTPPESCHWMVLVPREAVGDIELRFEAVLPLWTSDEGSCTYAPTHGLRGTGTALDIIHAELGETRGIETMTPLLPAFRYSSGRLDLYR